MSDRDERGNAPDARRYVAMPGKMDPLERAGRARALPEYLTRQEAADLAGVDVRAIDRWRRWHEETGASSGLKTHRADREPGTKSSPTIRVAKAELLQLIGFDPAGHPTDDITLQCATCRNTSTVPGRTAELPRRCLDCGGLLEVRP